MLPSANLLIILTICPSVLPVSRGFLCWTDFARHAIAEALAPTAHHVAGVGRTIWRRPTLLFIADLKTDPKDPYNQCVAAYAGNRSVTAR